MKFIMIFFVMVHLISLILLKSSGQEQFKILLLPSTLQDVF